MHPPLPKSRIETIADYSFEMVHISGGIFQMGGADAEAYNDEKPPHPVTVFYLGRYPVTQALWQAVMGENPSRFKGSDRPVEQVSWDDCKDFIDKLNQRTGRRYRLPSEAEWEYAARGGMRSEGYLYAGSDKLDEVGWYDANSDDETQPVGLKLPNEPGLYDMSGNVWEWCEDDWHGSYQGTPDDGSAWIDRPKRGARRVYRGGDWFDTARACRVSYRNYASPEDRVNDRGLRLACQFM
ncbi:MAG: formylglycine-generating enzyme family protein [Bacteroidia bacterium]